MSAFTLLNRLYPFSDGRADYLLSEGHLVGLGRLDGECVCAEGEPDLTKTLLCAETGRGILSRADGDCPG